MHRFILGPGPGEIDHRNGDGLDNQKKNLRRASHKSNTWNSRKHTKKSASPYKGVHWRKARCRWYAFIRPEGKKIYLGSFGNQKEAALAYDKAAKRYYGEFARLNFPNK